MGSPHARLLEGVPPRQVGYHRQEGPQGDPRSRDGPSRGWHQETSEKLHLRRYDRSLHRRHVLSVIEPSRSSDCGWRCCTEYARLTEWLTKGQSMRHTSSAHFTRFKRQPDRVRDRTPYCLTALPAAAHGLVCLCLVHRRRIEAPSGLEACTTKQRYRCSNEHQAKAADQDTEACTRTPTHTAPNWEPHCESECVRVPGKIRGW